MKLTAPRAQPIPTSYPTVPLASYSKVLQQTATDLFQRVAQRVGAARATNPPDGSLSIRGGSSKMTAAKIIIYELGRGKINGLDPGLADEQGCKIRFALGMPSFPSLYKRHAPAVFA